MRSLSLLAVPLTQVLVDLELTSWSDRAIARRIRDEGVDILVDLHGWSDGRRFNVLCQRPAPVQVPSRHFPVLLLLRLLFSCCYVAVVLCMVMLLPR